MKRVIKQSFKIANIQVDDILKSYRILRRTNAADTIELVLATDRDMGYSSGQRVSISLQSDADTYTAAFIVETVEKRGNTLTIIAHSALCPKTKGSYYSLSEDARDVAARIGAASSGLVSYPLSLSVERATKADALTQLCEITGAEWWERGGALIVADKRRIGENDTPVAELHERREILSLDVSVSAPTVSKVAINESEEEVIYATPSLVLALDYDPHPVTPTSPLVYQRGAQSYTISPLFGRAIVYYSPIDKEPTVSSLVPFVKKSGYKVVEKFTLDSDHSVTLSGGIASIIDIELDGADLTDYTFKTGHNTIAWASAKSGELRIAYTTDILYARLPPSTTAKKFPIRITHEDLIISHTYAYDYSGYYPLPFTRTISLITDFGLESNDASGALVTVTKRGVVTQSVRADAFGELEVTFQAYGVYALTAGGVTRWVTLFANEYNISADKPEDAIC